MATLIRMASLRYLPRSLLTYLVGLMATLLASAAVITVAHFRPTSPVIEKVAHWWSRAWLTAAGVRLETSGGEHINAGRSYVVVANHSSNFDVMACFVAVPIPIRFLAKKELFQLPILSSAMRAIGIVEVDRAARLAVHEQINSRARDLVAVGRSLIIYPEGTRSKAGALGQFKKGAFTIAVGSQLPILPVTIHGSHATWPPGSTLIRGGRIRVVIDPPVETTGMTQADTGRLRDRVHGLIESRLSELDQVPSHQHP